MRRLLATLPPLLLLVVIAGSIPATVMHILDVMFLPYMAGFTLLGLVVLWLLGPVIIDTLLQSRYNLAWYEADGFSDEAPDTAAFLDDCAATIGIDPPRIGVIPTDTPWVFPYGAGRWNARLIITRGVLETLDSGQQQALIAREIGHITRRDIGVLTALQSLYLLVHPITAAAQPARHRPRTYLAVLPLSIPAAAASIILRYTMLPLSWLRTYDADRFATDHAETTDLINGLIAVSEGVLASQEPGLIRATEPVAAQSLLLGRRVGLGAINRDAGTDVLETVLRYDIHSPWTLLTPFQAMHPPTGKRIARLPGVRASPAIDYSAITAPISAGEAEPHFLRVLLIRLLPHLLLLGYPLIYLGAVASDVIVFHAPTFIGGWMAVIGAGVTVRIIERYPPITPEPATVTAVLQRMLQPRPGRPVRIDGRFDDDADIRLPTDTVLTDETGRIPVKYRSQLPLLGSILDQQRIRTQSGEDAMVTGWLVADAWPRLDLRHMETRTDTVRGAVRIGALVAGLLLAVAGAAVITVF